jgi:acyl-CoA thioesterase-1
MRQIVLLLAIGGLLAGAACRPSTPSTSEVPVATPPPRSGQAAATDSTAKKESKPRIVFLGDSLTAGLGLTPEQSYPALLQRKLDERGYRYEVVNAGVSGDTSAGGLRRLDWSLEGDVKILVVALGGNDGLRGLSPQDMKANLSTVIDRASQKGITVILAGMEAPPNYGADYTRQFRDVYLDLAKTGGVRFVPFLLQGVAGISGLNQADGIHPNPRGAQLVADLMWNALEPVLARPAAVTQ